MNINYKSIKINYFDYISLSSNNNLINTLLFINRAYKTKTFIEFIMLNQIEFSERTKFVRKMIQKIFDKNYFFIIENKILDIPSKIKFIIKILNDSFISWLFAFHFFFFFPRIFFFFSFFLFKLSFQFFKLSFLYWNWSPINTSF